MNRIASNLPSGRSVLRGLSPFAVLLLAIDLTGCGMAGGTGSGGSNVLSPVKNTVYEGKVMGGEQPVVGATIQLYAAGAPSTGGGYGQGAQALIASGSQPVTGAGGSFSVTGLYTCPATPTVSQIYMVATGGNSGTYAANPYIALMAALGPCNANSTLSPNLNITINEVTTVASVYALQQFMAAPSAANVGAPNVGAPGNTYNNVQTAVIGLQNAFGMVNNMVNITNGTSTPANSWATPDNAGLNINTIADILVYCVNSSPYNAVTNPTGSTYCTSMFSSATPSTSPASYTAADTIQATWYIAQNPEHNVNTLYNYTSATSPFPRLSSKPNDFSLAVSLAPQYTSGSSTLYAVNTPHHVAIDAYGNAWLSNGNGGSSSIISTSTAAPMGVVELAPNGSVLMNPVSSFTASTSGGTYSQFTTAPSSTTITFNTPRMVAIDTNNNVWVANYLGSAGVPAAGSVAHFTGSTGVGVAGSVSGGYFVGSYPWGIAIDGHNNVYVSNSGNSGMDPLSVGRFAGGTGTYTYSTSSSAAAPNSLPNVQGVAGGPGTGNSPFNYYTTSTWSSVLAVDTNTGVTGGADGILWGASPACVTTSSSYDSSANIAWGVVDMFNADTLVPLSASEATTSFSGASTGAGSTTNCGSTTAGTVGDAALSGTGLQIGQTFTAAMASPYGIAVDKNNGLWIADTAYSTTSAGFNGLTYLAAPTASSGAIPASGYNVSGNTYPLTSSQTPSTTGSILRAPTYVAVDGNNNVWAVSQSLQVVSEATYSSGTVSFLNASSNEGYYHAPMVSAYGMAIDPSGNIWVTSTNKTSTYTGQSGASLLDGASMTVIVGAAAPVVTPLAEAVAANMLGQKP